MTAGAPNDERSRHWLVRRSTIRRLWIVFAVVLAATVLLDATIDHDAKFGIEATFAFAAWYGFGTCVAMIVAANALGRLLKRRDDYYDHD